MPRPSKASKRGAREFGKLSRPSCSTAAVAVSWPPVAARSWYLRMGSSVNTRCIPRFGGVAAAPSLPPSLARSRPPARARAHSEPSGEYEYE